MAGLVAGPLLLSLTILLPPPATMSAAAWYAFGMLLLMAVWWATEAIPIPATALLPICLVPVLGLGEVGDVTGHYAHPVIFLFLGGFLLGQAMRRWNLHRRIALRVLLAVGTTPKRQIAGFMLATAFLSMWVSNTATAIMMMPIGLSVINTLEAGDPRAVRRFATALLLAIAYSANVGGIATLIGTPPNVMLAGYLAENHGIEVGFAQWLLVGLPVALLMLVLIWGWLTRRDFGLRAERGSDRNISRRPDELGSWSRGEKTVAVVLSLAAAAWILRPLLADRLLPWLSDTWIAMAAAAALFLIPVKLGRFVLDWETARELPWGILLLFGGGLALAATIESSGLAMWLAESLAAMAVLPLLWTILLVSAVIIFLTEVTSNTATAATFLPLLGALAVAQGVDPVLLAVPVAMAASCAFMMPVATPPNAIAFASGHMRIADMIRAGIVLNLAGIVVITSLCYLLLGWIFTAS